MFDALPQPMTSGSAWISGVPTAVSMAEDLIENIGSYLGEAVTEASHHMTAELRSAAVMYPEWAPYADQLGVEWSNTQGGFVYYWQGNDEQIAHMKSLEYGRLFGSVPKSVTRKVAVRMEDRAGKLIQEILQRETGLA